MINRKGSIHCSCANALYPAQAIQWNNCNFTRISANFSFENFSWILTWATKNAVAGHIRPAIL